jgi:hypothetical protein
LPTTRSSASSPAEGAVPAKLADLTAAGPYAGRTLIIVNPYAGHEEPARLRRTLGGAFAELDAPFDLVATQHAGHAADLARDAANLGYRAVAACGGDGTLAEVASGLAGSNTPLAVLPRGTANQVAQNLGIPLDLTQAVDVAVNGRITSIDIGRIGDRAFALVAGAGFDAAVMTAATREMKERWGFAAYVYAAVKQTLTATPRRFHLTVDDRQLEVDAVSVMAANVGELFGKWLPLRVPLGPTPDQRLARRPPRRRHTGTAQAAGRGCPALARGAGRHSPPVTACSISRPAPSPSTPARPSPCRSMAIPRERLPSPCP